ncbi:DNA-binding IclR family transcriptional regulator [Cryobacterium mesophilum]|uniref:MarR family transcriptional regulator n=1 Tax=Terrimesophilobacter mesophilus TaxID=433647 RepID=A0A4R8VBF6_9MICO|nr:helix-turn-helix domain-containing protein [Terrimesophilobacter mesophilus]MBB5633612.1 DNA-binding IclR family transcriptional regulator [Terrimesophilobacter mesophilus]TFB80309.1 MarR family transcriptional regulator [Terrimesophilobacter mesophilus]
MATSDPNYAVPALDKALDILEFLADQGGGVGQGELADAVGRTPSQVFRVLQRLERRGWIVRERPSGLYLLSTRMLDLAHRQPRLRGLIALAIGPMRSLTEEVHQSCNLSVLDAGRVRVIAQAESPADFGFRVRVGAEFPLETPAGQVLTEGAPLGYLRQDDSLQPGITDLVAPVVDASGVAIAAITVPYIATSYSGLPIAAVLRAVTATGRTVSALVRGD